MSEDPLRVAVVGMGKMGLLHASVLNVLPDVELAGVCEKSSFTKKLLKKIFRTIPVVDDVSDFSGLDIDAVFVATPIPFHFTVAKAICQERLARHLFVEKPLCSNFSESKELCDLAATFGGVNMVGYLRRFMVTFIKARSLLLENVIGELFSFNIDAFSSDFCGITNNPKVSLARGGVLRDLGSYALDLALWFFNDFQVLSSSVDSITGKNSEDAVHAVVERKSDGLRGDFSISWCAEGYRMAEVGLLIRGSKGTIEVNDDRVSLNLGRDKISTWHRVDLDDTTPFWIGAPEYYREDAYFIKSAREHSIAEPSFATASKVDLIIERIAKDGERRD
jgi:predicted dehydrogenase